MRVLVCPTAFKESLTAGRVTRSMAEAVRMAQPESVIRTMPVSDGGPGFVETLAACEGGEVEVFDVRGPLGEPTPARSLWLSTGEVLVETADACGLHLVPEADRDPLRADTRGVGELVAECVSRGARRIIMGLGGSATVDGGTGLARALGYRFFGPDRSVLPPGGGFLGSLDRIEPRPAPGDGVRVTAVADVLAPLTGPHGAAHGFGPQKGASRGDVETLEAGLERLAERLRIDLGCEVSGLPGGGAAGGLGAGCVAFLSADLVPGSDWVLERLGFDAALAETDALITGEGAWDATSGLGKITWEILRRARAARIPAWLVCGRLNGEPPPGVTVLGGTGDWLDAGDVTRLVAEALG